MIMCNPPYPSIDIVHYYSVTACALSCTTIKRFGVGNPRGRGGDFAPSSSPETLGVSDI